MDLALLLARVLLALEPFALRLLFALELLALELLAVPLELRLLLVLEARALRAVERGLLSWLAVRRRCSPDVPEARVRPARELCPLLARVRFVAGRVALAVRLPFELRRPELRLPSFEAKRAVRPRRVISRPILLAATCAMVATPAPAAKALAAEARAFEACSADRSRVWPTRLIASPATVAATARAVSLSRILRALP